MYRRYSWGACYPYFYLDHHRGRGRRRSWPHHGREVDDRASGFDRPYRVVGTGALCWQNKGKKAVSQLWSRVSLAASATYLLTTPMVATHPGSNFLTSPLCNLTNTKPFLGTLLPCSSKPPPIVRTSEPPMDRPSLPW